MTSVLVPDAVCDCGSIDGDHALTCPLHDWDTCDWCADNPYDQTDCEDCHEGRLPDGSPHEVCGGHGFWGYGW